MRIHRGIWSGIALAAALWNGGAALAQSNFPNRPITIVVGNTAGGPLDATMRLIARLLPERLGPGTTVIVENRPGANGIIGGEYVAKSAPDGHTLLAMAVAHVINPSMRASMPFDALNDFTGVAHLAVARNVFVASTTIPPTTLAEYVTWAKQNPDRALFSSGGEGSGGHLMSALIGRTLGTPMTHIAYKGSSAALPDMLSGRVPLAVDTLRNVAPHVQAGKLRILAVTNGTRWPDLPDVPTFVESGYPAINTNSWIGLIAPARTPPDVVKRLASEIERIVAMPDVRRQISDFGLEVQFKGPAEFQSYMQSESRLWGAIVKSVGIKAE